jgi:hypothetical protein
MKPLKNKKTGLVLGGALVVIIALGFSLNQTHLISLNQPGPTPGRTLLTTPLTVLQTLTETAADNPDNLLVKLQISWHPDSSDQSVNLSFVASDPSGLGEPLASSAAGSATSVLPSNLSSGQTGWVTFEVSKQIHAGMVVATAADGSICIACKVSVHW